MTDPSNEIDKEDRSGLQNVSRSDISEDLLAQGIARFMPKAQYSEAPTGYGRIVHDLGRRDLPRYLPPQMLPNHSNDDQEGSGELTSIMLMDIESLGFIGRPLFLIGSLFARFKKKKWRLELVQYLARDYSEEEAVINAFLSEASDSDLWISYNGRSFDLPFIKLRATQFLLEPAIPDWHLDLLPVARRLWRDQLPNCKLKTIETYILERPRGHDIDGGRIPAAYHSFVRTGEPFDMLDILKHNAADLVGLLDIYERMLSEIEEAD